MDPAAAKPMLKRGTFWASLGGTAAAAATAGLLANLEVTFDTSTTVVVTGNPITLTVPACHLPPLRP